MNKLDIKTTKEKIYDLYIDQELSSVDIAKIYNIDRGTVLRYLRNCNIPIRPNSQAKKTKAYREKIKQTNLERYGVENSSQNEDIKRKKEKTCLNNYGVKYHNQSIIGKEQRKKTNLKRYGAENPARSHFSQDTMQKINDSEWLRKQHHIKKKTHKQIAEELNISHSAFNQIMKKHGIETKTYHNTSYIEEQWLIGVEKKLNKKIIRQYQVPDTEYTADGYNPETNTIYEFFGDFWHGNPKIYNSSDINLVNKKTFGELYESTCNKIEKYRTINGYKVIYIWESDFKGEKH